MLGTGEIIVILVIALLLFGPRLPKLARGAGQALGEFKKGLRDNGEDVGKALNDVKDEVRNVARKD